MRLTWLPGAVHLTYCTNIHAGESWQEISASLDEYVPAIKARIAPDQPFGIGLRLSGQAAASLLEPATLAAFQAQLARLDAYVFTINAFPYGPFHAVRVKEQVYLPDWRDGERLAYTTHCARILAQLLPDGMTGSISTVPGAFKGDAASAATDMARNQITAHLTDAVAMLAALERETGKHIALALEPEPCCMLETVDETLDYFAGHLLAAPTLARLGGLCDATPEQAGVLLRRHLGVCYDVCHAAVEFEDPFAALHRLRAAGLTIPKIQLSSALRIPRMDAELITALEVFDDGVYLHQVVVRPGQTGQTGQTGHTGHTGQAGRSRQSEQSEQSERSERSEQSEQSEQSAQTQLRRFTDLPEAIAAFRRGELDGEWRIHCHVPVFLDDLGLFSSTGAQLRATLKALQADAFSPHLEVETYTWDVLPEPLKAGSKASAIARELAFIIQELET